MTSMRVQIAPPKTWPQLLEELSSGPMAEVKSASGLLAALRDVVCIASLIYSRRFAKYHLEQAAQDASRARQLLFKLVNSVVICETRLRTK